MRGLILKGAAILALLAILGTSNLLVAQTPVQSAWDLLEDVRESLAASLWSAVFVQEFRPAGFSSGDRENGLVYLGLPDCIRWDYEGPLQKNFLLCDNQVYLWNVGETTGRRHSMNPDEQPGLDLLSLRTDQLRDRYEAGIETPSADSIEIILTPLLETTELASAGVAIDRASNRPTKIEYLDRQGNLTTFNLSEYRELDTSEPFQPPPDLQWIDQ